jgi:hypothetical protein
MQRRSNDVIGMVNFPVDSEEYKSSGEGGMFVQLWCIEEEFHSCGICCGYDSIFTTRSEVLVGTETEKNTDNFHEIEEGKNPVDWEQKFHLTEKLFDRPLETCDVCRYSSIPLIACVTMGSTGWSGWDGDEYWRCKYKDLNDAGQTIYDSLKSAYPKSKLLLVTFLDT